MIVSVGVDCGNYALRIITNRRIEADSIDWHALPENPKIDKWAEDPQNNPGRVDEIGFFRAPLQTNKAWSQFVGAWISTELFAGRKASDQIRKN